MRYPITRTIEKTKVVALLFDKTTAEAHNETVVLARKLNDAKAIEKAVRKLVETDDNIKLVDIVDVSSETACYGITEQDFLAHAVELDPRTRNPLT